MADPARTTTLLLEGLIDPTNVSAWSQFDRRYRPVILAFAQRLGLSDADAADVAQDTMSEFVSGFRTLPPRRGHERLELRLQCLARTMIARTCRESRERRECGRDSALSMLSDEERLTGIWECERRRVMMRQAMHQLRTTTRLSQNTIAAFELLVIHQRRAQVVADELGMKIADVYAAKSRVARRLREILEALEVSYREP